MTAEAEFRATVWETGNSAVLTIPSHVVSSRGVSKGMVFDVKLSLPSFVIHLPYSATFNGFLPIAKETQLFFPTDRRERFTIEEDGKAYWHRVAAGKIAGMSTFFRAHPKISRVRVRVLEWMKAYRLEYEPSWEA